MKILRSCHSYEKAGFKPQSIFSWAARLGCVAAASLSPLAQAQDLPEGVVADSVLEWQGDQAQPDGAWQYGYYTASGSPDTFTQLVTRGAYYPGSPSWIGGDGQVWQGTPYPRVGKYSVAPAYSQPVVRRWTSNFKGTLWMQIDCQQLQDSANDQLLQLYRNGTLEQDFRKSTNSHHLIYQESCAVEIGDVLDFVIDPRTNNAGDWTHLSVRLHGKKPCEEALFYYPFDERADYSTGWAPHGELYDRSARVGDYSGNDHHAVLVNMSGATPSQPGVHDQARYFDGVDDYVLVEKPNLGDGLTAMTLSAWVSPEGELVKNGGVMTTTGGQDFVGLLANAESGLIEFRTVIGGRDRVVTLAEPLATGEWVHLTGVWESGKRHILYVNGEEAAFSFSSLVGTLDIDQWHIGQNSSGTTPASFRGLIDEVSVLPRALVHYQVKDLYREHAPMTGPAGTAASYYNGSDDLSVVSSEAVDGVSELTLSTWVAPFSKDANDGVITSAGSDFFGLILSGRGEGQPIEFRAKSVSLTGPDYSCPAGQWNHVAGVWKSGQIHKLYLNGVEVASNANPPAGTIDIAQWLLGRDRAFGNRSFHGLLEDYHILPQALTATEIAALYQENLPLDYSGPVEMAGYLRWDYAFGVFSNSLAVTTRDENFHRNAFRGYHTGFIDSTQTGVVRNQTSASRLRGYIEAPESGEYYFWVSGNTALDLSLSPDDQKFTKEVIARLSPDIGTSGAITPGLLNIWDTYFSQLSEPIQLEAGQRYYLDVLQTNVINPNPFISIAWARPDGLRELIPMEHLRPYVQETSDIDDDYLPDSWETQYGLNPADNGGTDLAREGEYGDFDDDGLTNREEYLLGTNPANADTDGDGLSDLAEQNVHGTNPVSSDARPETIVANLDLQSVNDFGTTWIETGSGGVLAANFRATATFDFTVPSDGHWILQLEGQLRGDLRFDETLPVHLAIDGQPIERTTITFRNGLPGAIRTVTPRLTAGPHQFSLFIDNYTTRRTLEILSIKLITPGGLDSDSNSTPDWVDTLVAERSQVLPHDLYSYVSPAFIEGHAPSETLVDLTVITRSGEHNRLQRYTTQQWGTMLPQFENRLSDYADRLQTQMRAGHGRMEGSAITHNPGPGTHKWFTAIDLMQNEAIGYVAQFENLGTYQHGKIAWTACNVFEQDILTIAQGSKLLLGAWIQDWDWQTITLTVDGAALPQPHTASFPSSQSYVHHFTEAGTYTVTATHPGGTTGTLTVHVRTAELPVELVVGEQRFRDVILPGVASDLALDTGGEIAHTTLQTEPAGGSSSRFGGTFPGVYRTAARLSATDNILDQKVTHVVGVSDALRNSTDTVSPIEGDLFLVRSPLLVTHLPAGARIEIVIFAGGVTFPDGTTIKEYTQADLDESGVILQEFVMPRERLGAPCHYINIYDSQGTRVWNSTN